MSYVQTNKVVIANMIADVDSQHKTTGGKIQYEIRNELETDYSYATSPSGGLITTITYPGGGTEVREEYADGKLKCVTGTSVSPALYYSYGTNANASEWTRADYGSTNSSNYLTTTVDWLGRTIREEQPAYSGLFVRQYFYNSKGQLWKLTATGLADRLNEFDEMGDQTRSGLDMDASGTLVLASKDRIEDSAATYEQSAGIWYRVTRSTRYLTDDSAVASHSYQKERLNLPLNTLSEIHLLDPAGNETIRTTTVNRSAKLVTETVQMPGSSTSPAGPSTA